MKILFAIPGFGALFGGPTNQVFHILNLLSEMQYELALITCDYKLDNFYIPRLNKKIKLEVLKNKFGSYRYLPDLREALNIYKDYDIIHLHSYWSYMNIVCHRFCLENRLPYILSAYYTTPIILRNYLTKSVFNMFWGNKIINDADYIIALSSDEEILYNKRGIDKKKIARIPVAVQTVSHIGKENIFRETLGLKQREKLILFLSRINKKKGLDWFIPVFSKVKDRVPGTKLAIVGSDDGYLACVKKVVEKLCLKKDVFLLGPVFGDEKWDIYSSADIFVLPSISDAVPAAALEASIAGLPLIITRTCGIPEVTTYNAGFEIDYGDSNALGNALIALLKDDTLRKKCGENAKRMVLDNFTWDKVIKMYEEIYEKAFVSKYLNRGNGY